MTDSTNDEKFVVNLQQSNRPYEIIGVLLGMGGLGAIAYAITQQGWVELASTGLTMFIFQFVSMAFKSGLLRLPEKKGGGDADFQATAGLLRTAWNDFQSFQARSPKWRLGLIALAFTVTFMIARWLIGLALLIFTNLWVAVGFGALLGMVIVAPGLVGNGLKKLKSRTGVRTVNELRAEDTDGALRRPVTGEEDAA